MVDAGMRILRSFLRCLALLGLVSITVEATAAGFEPFESRPRDRVGAFAGGHVRIALSGRSERRAVLRLTVAPAALRSAPQRMATRHIGAGLSLDFSPSRPVEMRLGSQSLWRSGPSPRHGAVHLSPVATAGVVVGGAALVAAIIFAAQVAEANRNSD